LVLEELSLELEPAPGVALMTRIRVSFVGAVDSEEGGGE
jgi:hypothetical protein